MQNATATDTSEPTLCLIDSLGLDTLTNENTENVLNEAISAISEHLGADHGYIVLKDDKGELATIASISRDGQSEPQMTASDAVIDNVMKSGAGIVVENAMQQFEKTGFRHDAPPIKLGWLIRLRSVAESTIRIAG